MQVDRFLQLVEWGFNVPLFVVNPNSSWKNGTFQLLIEHFQRPKTLTILAAQKDGSSSLHRPNLPLGSIFVESVVLEHKYKVIVMEDVSYEFKGWVRFDLDGTGEYSISKKQPVRFSTVELVESVKMRCIVRILTAILEKVKEPVVVQFCWAKKFCGVKNSRLIVFDYSVV